LGHVHADAAQAAFLRRRIGAVDLGREIDAKPQPVERRALRVEIHDRGRDPVRREVAGEVGREGGLPRAALRIDHQRRVHLHDRRSPRPPIPTRQAYARTARGAVNYFSCQPVPRFLANRRALPVPTTTCKLRRLQATPASCAWRSAWYEERTRAPTAACLKPKLAASRSKPAKT